MKFYYWHNKQHNNMDTWDHFLYNRRWIWIREEYGVFRVNGYLTKNYYDMESSDWLVFDVYPRSMSEEDILASLPPEIML